MAPKKTTKSVPIEAMDEKHGYEFGGPYERNHAEYKSGIH